MVRCQGNQIKDIHIHVDYRDVPVEWFGQDLIDSAEAMKEADEKMYRWTWLGEPVGVDELIYYMFSERHRKLPEKDRMYRTVYIGGDYGQQNATTYINALLCDRYYEINQYGTDAAGKDEQMEGLYWMGVSGKLGSQLFEQVFERYTTYSRYYSGGFSKENKERYYIKEHWKITEYQKTGFEELIVAEGTGDYNGDWMLFAKTQDEVIVLRYWGEASGEMLMEAIVDEYS